MWYFGAHVAHSSVHILGPDSPLPKTVYAAVGAARPSVRRAATGNPF